MQGARRMAAGVDVYADVLSEILEHWQQLRHALRRHEAPFEIRIDEFSGVARDLGRRVVGGVQTDADEAYAPRESGVAPDAIAQFGERRVGKRTAQGIQAVGVKEREQRNLAFRERREAHGPVRTLEQHGVRDALDLLQPVAPRRRGHEFHARRRRLAGIDGGARNSHVPDPHAGKQQREHAHRDAGRRHHRADTPASAARRG